MTTPAFANTSASLAAVRLYTAADPYHYTIDNRPLTDMVGNDSGIATSTDAARRADMINSISQALEHQWVFGNITGYIRGLTVSAPASNTIRIDVGGYFQPLAINAVDSRIMVKKAIRPYTTDFAINTVSISGSQSVVYAIEAKAVDFSASTTNTFPLYDNTNTYLPATLLNQELQLQITPGVAATTGSQVPPATTSGWFQLYWVTVNGASPTVYSNITYPTSPTFNSWGMTPTFLPLTNSTSTPVTVGDSVTSSFATASTQLALSNLPLVTNGIVPTYINPYKPVKFKILYSVTITGGNVAFQVKYQFLSLGTSVSATSYSTLTSDVTAISATANQLATLTLTNGVVPTFAGAAAERLNLGFSRITTGDTSTGAFQILSIQAFQ